MRYRYKQTKKDVEFFGIVKEEIVNRSKRKMGKKCDCRIRMRSVYKELI